MLRLVTLACIFSSGCAHMHKPTNIKYKPCVSPEIVILESTADDNIDAPLKSAIKYWRGVIGKDVLINHRRMHLVDDGRSDPYIAIRIASIERIRKWDDNVGGSTKPHYGGIYPNRCLSGSSIWIKDDGMTSQKMLYFALIHELGHSLGLNHSDDVGSIMYYKVGKQSLRIGEDTSKEIERLYW